MRVKDDKRKVVQAQHMKIDPGLKSKPMDQGGAPKDKFVEAETNPDGGGTTLKQAKKNKKYGSGAKLKKAKPIDRESDFVKVETKRRKKLKQMAPTEKFAVAETFDETNPDGGGGTFKQAKTNKKDGSGAKLKKAKPFDGDSDDDFVKVKKSVAKN